MEARFSIFQILGEFMKTILSVIGAITVLFATLLLSLMLYLNVTFGGLDEGKKNWKR